MDANRPSRNTQTTLYYLFLLALVFAFWNCSNSFFWRDEWNFLRDYKEHVFFFFQPHAGHIFPVFKLFYLLELTVFGTNSILYLYANLLIHYATYALVFYFLRRTARIGDNIALLITAILVVHPANFNTVLWNFQSNQLLQLLFQFLSVIFFVFFVEKENKFHLVLAASFLILSNYCFGNGLLMPITFIAGSIFISNRSLRYSSIAFFSVLLVAFLAVQAIFGGRTPEFSFRSFLESYLYYQSVDLFRYFFIKNPAFLTNYIVFFIVVPLAIIAFRFNKIARNPMAVIYLFWYFATSILIPAARTNLYLSDFPMYYSFGSFLPFALFIVETFKDEISVIGNRRFKLAYPVTALLIVVLGAYYFVDRRMVAVFSNRNAKNLSNLTKAIEDGTEYVAFDDSYFDPSFRLQLDEANTMDAKDIYIYWRKRDLLSHQLFDSDENVAPK